MAVTIAAVDRFTTLKRQRDDISNKLATFQGKLEGSRDRYNDIMVELAAYGIGSLDELNAKIADLDKQINVGLDEAEKLLITMEGELKTLEGIGVK